MIEVLLTLSLCFNYKQCTSGTNPVKQKSVDPIYTRCNTKQRDAADIKMKAYSKGHWSQQKFDWYAWDRHAIKKRTLQ